MAFNVIVLQGQAHENLTAVWFPEGLRKVGSWYSTGLCMGLGRREHAVLLLALVSPGTVQMSSCASPVHENSYVFTSGDG